MTNENDINEALRKFNQNALLNKKRIDIENIVESLLLFFNNYFSILTNETTIKVMEYKNVNSDDPYKEIVSTLMSTFFNLIENKIKEITVNNFNTIKNKISKLTDIECNKELSHVSQKITNEISDYYLTNANDLVNELNKEDNNKNVSEYILNIIYFKVINTLKDRLMYSIKVIDNNYEENNQKIESINEKTINKV